jgi:hypothetical protein
MAAMPAQAHALACLEERDIGSDCIDHTGDLMPWNARIGDAGKEAKFSD